MTLIHTICGKEKCNTHIMTLIHIIYGRGKCNAHIMTLIVITLALGSRPRQGLARVQAKREA
jgi:hypothetical protein